MKLEALDHPKTLDFASRLNIDLPTAIGHLELFWAFTGKKSPQGNIGKWPDGAIARACYWMGDPQSFLQALLQSRLIDADTTHRYTVHDWRDHAPRWVKAKLSQANLSFVGTTGATTGSTVVEDNDSEGSTVVPPISPTSKGREEKGREEKNKEQDSSTSSPVVPLKLTSVEPVPKVSQDIIRVFDHWKTIHGRQKSKLDEKRTKLIRLALKTYTAEQLCQCISGYRRSSWHMGANDSKKIFNDIELFLRDAKHIDAGIEHAEKSANGSQSTDDQYAAAGFSFT